MRYGAIVQRDGQCRKRVTHLTRYSARYTHTVDYQVASCQCIFGISHGRVAGRGIHNTYQHGSLLNIQLIGSLAKEGAGCRLDTKSIGSVLYGIQIHCCDLLLGIVVLELEGCDPLLELRLYEFPRAAHLATVANGVTREEVFRHLLCDCRSTALRLVAHGYGADHHAEERGDIDSRVVAEAYILRRDKRRYNGRYTMPVEHEVAS